MSHCFVILVTECLQKMRIHVQTLQIMVRHIDDVKLCIIQFKKLYLELISCGSRIIPSSKQGPGDF